MPRVAIQVTGLPRFCRETDRLFAQWCNYQEIDWYFCLNSRYSETMTRLDPGWFDYTEEELAQEIQQRLPQQQRVKMMVWHDVSRDEPGPFQNRQGYYADIHNCWLAYKLAQRANTLRRFLSIDQRPYDLIVRARLDAAADCLIDLVTAAAQARTYPRAIAVSQGQRQGALGFNDQLIWGSEQAMNLVADSVDWWPRAAEEGLELNPEILTSWVLRLQNLEWPLTDWNTTLKTQGSYDSEGRFSPELGTWQLARDHL